ncbi:MAG: hypothetical protein Q8K78_06860, partial [Planctomycetaceae bacterium]|nr:hypothetical protein [Planctomycetaceae bacterium]
LFATICVGIFSGSVWKDNPRLDVRELRLVDDDGHPRMLLTLAGNGHPKILMLDADGRVRAQYTAELLAFEDRGTPRVWLGANNHLQLFDGSGTHRVDLSANGSGSFLKLKPGSGRAFARIGVSNTGEKFVTQSTSAQSAER